MVILELFLFLECINGLKILHQRYHRPINTIDDVNRFFKGFIDSILMIKYLRLQITFLLLTVLFATLSIIYDGTSYNIIFSIVAGIFVILLVGVIVYRSWIESKNNKQGYKQLLYLLLSEDICIKFVIIVTFRKYNVQYLFWFYSC